MQQASKSATGLQEAPTGLAVGSVAIWVRDLDRSKDFYTAGLGLEALACIDAGDVREVIVGRPGSGSQLMLAARDGEPAGVAGGIWKVYLESQDAAGDYARALRAGATPVAEPRRLPRFAVTVGLVLDPDGYLLEIGQVHG